MYSFAVEKRGVVITVNPEAGLHNGVQTLRQLMVHQGGKTTVAVCKITDDPAFQIRGFMHDGLRNLKSIDQLKMQIDEISAIRMCRSLW